MKKSSVLKGTDIATDPLLFHMGDDMLYWGFIDYFQHTWFENAHSAYHIWLAFILLVYWIFILDTTWVPFQAIRRWFAMLKWDYIEYKENQQRKRDEELPFVVLVIPAKWDIEPPPWWECVVDSRIRWVPVLWYIQFVQKVFQGSEYTRWDDMGPDMATEGNSRGEALGTTDSGSI
ncbi:hypothetical protein H072_8294 [Dactylellina haptotyla CBS 200.50]|uniref:Uncharacterized protein n=1 Tax=Dactylellina haptotyla (strain CBS 200.50) TaxID=1284197 RepID=S8AA84_DACHA|nr:hypothetical protein H072_8294 [Dactylellina haptotyla CBS 200.50]